MFRSVECLYLKDISFEITVDKIQKLNQLLELCPEKCTVYTDREAKKYLDEGVVTITDGYRTERYPYLELVMYRLPPVLFSNNIKFVHALQRTILLQRGDPLLHLIQITETYYRRFKRLRGYKLGIDPTTLVSDRTGVKKPTKRKVKSSTDDAIDFLF